MGEPLFLGIDIGTYESKGALVNGNAEVIASHACPHLMESPHPGWAEHDALKTWWADFCEISNTLIDKSGVDPAAIRAVGCSTIAPCCLPVDRECSPLRKAMLYGVDVRAGEEIRQIEAVFGADAVLKRCGSPVTSQSAAAKMLWLKKNEPHVYRQTYKFVTGTTFLVAKLTGNYVIDRYTAAAWVPLYSIDSAGWDGEAMGMFCKPGQLARCLWSHEAAGTVGPQAAVETGLAPGTPVIAGTADAAAEAVSAGVFMPGDLLVMYGSSIFLIHVVEKPVRDGRLWAGPYLFPGTFAATGGMSSAGTLTRWFRDNFAKDLTALGGNGYELLMREADGVPAGSCGLIALPYFSGERTPINDPKARGALFGLNLLHTRAHVYQACLEGVGYGIAQHLDIFEERRMGTQKIMAVGGGTKNGKWLQIVSDITGRTQHIPSVTIGAAYGDALLAALGAGHYKTTAELAAKIGISGDVRPNGGNTQTYKPYREAYAELYRVTKDLMHGMP